MAADDDLNTPLGQKKPKRKRLNLPFRPPQVLAVVLGLFSLVAIGWAVLGNDPNGGQPVAVVATMPPSQDEFAAARGGNRQHARHDGMGGTANPAGDAAKTSAAKPTLPPGAQTVTIIDGSSGKRRNVVIPGNSGGKPPVNRDLLQMTPQGAIPQVAPDGTRVSSYYAQPVKVPANRSDAPRIAVIVGGLGISAHDTAEALARLPGPVTLAITPYGTGLEALAEEARAKKHELLLQVPMEPFNYPNNDPGPRTLLTGLSPAQNVARLHWLMGRFKGYVGLINYMGGKFTGSEPSLTPVVSDAGKRGLIYVDDGTSARSVAAEVAGAHNVPFAKASIELDAVPTPQAIDEALARLELAARDNGVAIGFASAEPSSIASIAKWAKTVESRGYVLVPITMVAVKAKSS